MSPGEPKESQRATQTAKTVSRSARVALVLGLALVLSSVYRFVLPKAKAIAEQNATKLASPEAVEESYGTFDIFASSPEGTDIFISTLENPRSRLPMEVESYSYWRLARLTRSRHFPHKNMVRIEQMLNFFDYNYPPPTNDQPFSITLDTMDCPWSSNKLLRVGLRAKESPPVARKGQYLVFVVDVSRSMDSDNKLPLLKNALRKFTQELTDQDQVSIVALGGTSEILLQPTSGHNKPEIQEAIKRLRATRPTPTGEGLEFAYNLAGSDSNSNNVRKVILCTDGDIDIEMVGTNSLKRAVANMAKEGVTLSTLAVGVGNFQTVYLERLAEIGKGTHEYVNTTSEAIKAFTYELRGSAPVAARNCRLHLYFNSSNVAAYRLLGFSNSEDSDAESRLDSLEVVNNHELTALYEIVPAQSSSATDNNWLTLKLYYTDPFTGNKEIMKLPFSPTPGPPPDNDFKFAAAVAFFGMLLTEQAPKTAANFDTILKLAAASQDGSAERREFLDIANSARDLLERQR